MPVALALPVPPTLFVVPDPAEAAFCPPPMSLGATGNALAYDGVAPGSFFVRDTVLSACGGESG